MASPADSVKPTPLRRWLRFSLRGLLIAVTLLCVWLGWHVDRSNRQKDAAAAIRMAGGETYQYGRISHRFGIGGGLSGTRRAMIQRWFNRHFFYEVKAVSLWDARDLSAAVAELHKLPDLEALWVGGKPIGDPDLERIASQTGMWQLSLAGTDIDDGDLAALRSLVQLEALKLSDTHVSDLAFVHLAELPRLRYLVLDGTAVTDGGLAGLSQLRSLTTVKLNETEIGDAGIEHLRKLRHLMRIELWDTHVSEAGLQKLREALPDANVVGRTRANDSDNAGSSEPRP